MWSGGRDMSVVNDDLLLDTAMLVSEYTVDGGDDQ
jgi:hypothetical protein